MPTTPPPKLFVDSLIFTAKIDYATFTNHGIRITLPQLSGSHDWTREKRGSSSWQVTIQDPTPSDLRTICAAYENPVLMGIEVAVDIAPKDTLSPGLHLDTLNTLYSAVAARFRPEDKALWDYGVRGAVRSRGQKPQPLERRHPRPDEQVIYGHRGDFMQAKLYLKTMDQRVALPISEQRVRIEISLKRWACIVFGLDRAENMFGYPYRSKFTTHFRIVDRPEVRAARGLSPEELHRRTKRMHRAWATAGVGKFAVDDHPREDRMNDAAAKIRARETAQLPADQFKLVRDRLANARIGNALTGLQRRMRAV